MPVIIGALVKGVADSVEVLIVLNWRIINSTKVVAWFSLKALAG